MTADLPDRAALARRLYDALAKGDAAALEELLDPAFEGTTTAGLPLGLGGRYAGPAAMREDFWWRIGRHYRAEAEPEEFHELPDGRLQVSGRYRGEGRRSGRPLDAAFVHVLGFHGGRISALDQLTDSAAWAQALGEPPLEKLGYRVEDGIAHVTLNRPEARNAIDLQVAEETLAVARLIEADPAVRAVLISGEGPSLTVGGDIGYFRDHADGDLGALFGRMITPFQEAFRILSRIDAPIVTAAHGAIAGGGLGFVYAADIVVAADNARFVTAFADLAVSGDGGGSWHLPRLIGPARARQVLLQNRPISAAEALDWGLVAELAAPDELGARALTIAQSLAAGPTRAFGVIRSLLRESWDNSLSEQLAAELRHMYPLGRSRDAAEAVTAFIEKRPARFEGK